MGRMVEMLVKAERLSPEEQKKLRQAVQMRNRAVHDLREPDRAEALKVYEKVARFVRETTMRAEQSPLKA